MESELRVPVDQFPAKDNPFGTNVVVQGNSYEVLKAIPDNTFTAVVTDPPYGLSKQPDMYEVLRHWMDGDDYNHGAAGFMGKSWDSFVPGPKLWEEVFRVLKPGGHVLSFSGTRTYDLMVTAMRLASFEIRDKLDYYVDTTGYRSWVYGEGFPKSRDIGKALEGWDGYGTALKPAHEPVAQFTKPDENGEYPESPDAPPFLYSGKASTKERTYGCKWMRWVLYKGKYHPISKADFKNLQKQNKELKARGEKEWVLREGNIHPTVKPLSLCRYLIQMVKMPGENLILDPFCGSGSVLCAALLEDCEYFGIDSDPMSVALSEARTHYFRCLGEKGLR
jgi:site-specific DNA-methyltransferase (adenine-specific)